MEEISSWINSNHLLHIPTMGVRYTWQNGRRGRANTQNRLDRVICNHLWLDACNGISCTMLNKTNFDHYPSMLDFDYQDARFMSQFKFLQIWSHHPGCEDIKQSVWSTNFVGCLMFVLNRKLQILKAKLNNWNLTVFGNVTDNVVLAENKLKNIQL